MRISVLSSLRRRTAVMAREIAVRQSRIKKLRGLRVNAVKHVVAIVLCAAAFTFPSSSCIAQQVTGELGSPNATTTIPGNQLPSPDPNFGGVIKEKASESTPWWPPRIVPPKGAPNILLIMTDDEGFGAPSTFGGVIETPALDRIAKNGLRYTQFHTTSLCAPLAPR